jgi:hypothetical protein
MGLADDLVAKFAKAVNAKNDTKNTSGTKLQGTIHFKDDKPYVKLDGSDILTPVQLTANVIENERVTVTIKDHMAIVDGNLSSPAARTDDLKDLKTQVEKIKDRRRSVYYQDEEPTDGSYEEGDIWFDTDAGNKMHYYEDGEWVEAQFDSDAIAPQAITTEKIDAKAVRAAQIDVKDLFAQDIEASGKIIGGRFISKPMECWGGFAKEDLDFLHDAYWEDYTYATLTDRQKLYFDLDSDGVIGDVTNGDVTTSVGVAISAWLEGDDSFIPSSYFEKEGIDKCLCQVVIDTTNPDEAISIIIDRSYYGLSTIKHTVIGRSEAFFNYLTSNCIRVGTDFGEGTMIDHYIATEWLETDLICSMPDPNNDNKQVLKLDAPDGITAEGPVNANDGVNIPLRADNSYEADQETRIMVATPTAGAINLPSTQGITDVISTYKSFIGSIYAKNAWNNVISVRHRNGASDGNSHGMYLRSLMNNKTPDLIWAVQAAGTWQSERTILDSSNYKDYSHDRLSHFISTSKDTINANDNATNAIGHTYATLFGQNDGALYTQAYSDKYVHEIFGDYITGQLAARGKNNGVWQNWRTILDSSNYSNYAVPKTGGTFTGAVNANAGINVSSDFPMLTLTRSTGPYYAGITFRNTLGTLGAFGMAEVNGSLTRFRSDLTTKYDLLDTENYSSKIPTATQSAVGLMSAADKKKVDNNFPTSNQNATNGYIRFPSAKIQIAWIKKTVTTAITTPWGGLYENASAISIGNWAAAFSSVPAISYNVYVSSGDNADTGVNSFSPPTTTSAGSVYLNRGTALSISRSYTITAIGIGTYA